MRRLVVIDRIKWSPCVGIHGRLHRNAQLEAPSLGGVFVLAYAAWSFTDGSFPAGRQLKPSDPDHESANRCRPRRNFRLDSPPILNLSEFGPRHLDVNLNQVVGGILSRIALSPIMRAVIGRMYQMAAGLSSVFWKNKWISH